MPDKLKPEPDADFVAGFRDGEAMPTDWMAGRTSCPICCTCARHASAQGNGRR
jgi:hypothetical protein